MKLPRPVNEKVGLWREPATAALAPALGDDEVLVAFPVLQGSALLGAAVIFISAAVVLGPLHQQSHRAFRAHVWVEPLVLASVASFVWTVVLKQRIVVLTMHRLLVCRRRSLGGVGQIVAERSRDHVRIERPERDRLRVRQEGYVTIRLRFPAFAWNASEQVLAWVKIDAPPRMDIG